MTNLVYFSSVSGNTRRFVEKLGVPAERIPLFPSEQALHVSDPYVLVLPTYGGGEGRGAVPKQVIRFLNDEGNRRLIRGVIAAGNTNFGEGYCLAGDIVGTPDDVQAVHTGLEEFWLQQSMISK
jgi:protein involved in ribonucleotide reduction